MALEPERFNERAMALFRAALDDSAPSENVVCSPLGIASAFAVGELAQSDSASSGGRRSPGGIGLGSAESVAASVRTLRCCGAMRLGNLLHVHGDKTLDADFLSLFEGSFEGKVHQIAASVPDTAAREDIRHATNTWAAELTDGTVKRVFDGESEEAAHAQSKEAAPLAAEPRGGGGACLVNLVHVCSRWQEGFSQAGQQPFYAQPERSKMVAMMSKAGDFPYARDTAFSCLRLFYDCHAVDVALFLPTLRAGLHEMLPALGCWKDVRAALDRTAWTSEVTVTLPKALLESPALDLRKSPMNLVLSQKPSATGAPPLQSQSKPTVSGEQQARASVEAIPASTGTDLSDSSFKSAKGTMSDLQRSSSSVAAAASTGSPWPHDVFHKATFDMAVGGGRSPPGFSALLSLCTMIPANKPVRFTVDRPFMFVVLKDDLLVMVGLIRHVHAGQKKRGPADA